ncbi:MAG: hypothetical protein GF334_06915 [Candidatus Altiarchaeales archaeon]|nr:hypothetical protein [Candidatus Altiarchaeales archaeon]
MIKNEVTVQDVCNLFNEIIAKDPRCAEDLIEARVQCNNVILNHPTIQVRQSCEDQYPKVGLLGFLNGLFGISENGMGALCAVYDDDGNLQSLQPTDTVEFTDQE